MRYFDTSFLVPLFLEEASSLKVANYLAANASAGCATSRWTRLEFGSLLGIRVRRQLLKGDEALRIEASLDNLLASFTLFDIQQSELGLASDMMREHGLGLRAGDALHLATARNRDVDQFVTLDKTLIRSGRHFGIEATAGVSMPGYEPWQ
jgi:uncharacterized protein